MNVYLHGVRKPPRASAVQTTQVLLLAYLGGLPTQPYKASCVGLSSESPKRGKLSARAGKINVGDLYHFILLYILLS